MDDLGPIPPLEPLRHGHGLLWMTGFPFGQVPVTRPRLSMDSFDTCMPGTPLLMQLRELRLLAQGAGQSAGRP
jgi:hypothetical protein